jgi:hypothetical protein
MNSHRRNLTYHHPSQGISHAYVAVRKCKFNSVFGQL